MQAFSEPVEMRVLSHGCGDLLPTAHAESRWITQLCAHQPHGVVTVAAIVESRIPFIHDEHSMAAVRFGGGRRIARP